MEGVKPPPAAAPAPAPAPARTSSSSSVGKEAVEEKSFLLKLPRWSWRCEEYVFLISYATGMSLWHLPMEKIDGNPVPTIVFKGQPKTFHSFLLGLLGAFTCAVCTIYIRNPSPKLARYYRRFAVFFLALTLLIASWAAGPAGWFYTQSL